VVGQLDGIDKLTGGFEPIAIDELEQKAHQVDFINPRGTDIGRLRGDPVHEGVEALLGDGAKSDEIIAEAAAMLGEAHKCARHILFSDELGVDEQIP
jgi:hypothetical protein